MTQCKFSARCKNTASYTVTMKAVGKREAWSQPTCEQCASMIGAAIGQPLTEVKETAFYRLTDLEK